MKKSKEKHTCRVQIQPKDFEKKKLIQFVYKEKLENTENKGKSHSPTKVKTPTKARVQTWPEKTTRERRKGFNIRERERRDERGESGTSI